MSSVRHFNTDFQLIYIYFTDQIHPVTLLDSLSNKRSLGKLCHLKTCKYPKQISFASPWFWGPPEIIYWSGAVSCHHFMLRFSSVIVKITAIWSCMKHLCPSTFVEVDFWEGNFCRKFPIRPENLWWSWMKLCFGSLQNTFIDSSFICSDYLQRPLRLGWTSKILFWNLINFLIAKANSFKMYISMVSR